VCNFTANPSIEKEAFCFNLQPYKPLRTSVRQPNSHNKMFILRLGLVSSVVALVRGYTMNQNVTSLLLRLTDVETNTSKISTIFLDKDTKVSIDGLSWAAQDNETNSSGFLDYILYLNGEEVESASLSLLDHTQGLPTTIDVGTFSVPDGGDVVIQVVLTDNTQNSMMVETSIRAHQAWIIGIPILVAFFMFLFLRADLVPTFFLAMFVGSWIIEGSIVDGFQAVFTKYIFAAVSNSSHMSM
jgi:hypothetical protein